MPNIANVQCMHVGISTHLKSNKNVINSTSDRRKLWKGILPERKHTYCDTFLSSQAPGRGAEDRVGATFAAQPSGSGSGPRNAQSIHSRRKQRNIMTGILEMSSVPYSSYVPKPETFLHYILPELKLLWIVGVLFILAKASLSLRMGMAGFVAIVTIVSFPKRIWRPQLIRVGAISALILLLTAIGSDGASPILSSRGPSVEMASTAGLGQVPLSMMQSKYLYPSYKYVMLNLGLFSITKRSFALAITLSTLTFITFQLASLCLITTQPERMAEAMKKMIYPLKFIGVPVQSLYLMLLLSLRFISTVFEETRNLVLALASRGIEWNMLGASGTITIIIRTATKLFKNLIQRSESISSAMVARGFISPSDHIVYTSPRVYQNRGKAIVVNVSAVLLFLLCIYGTKIVH